ncbi:MAG: DUF922 domain-containing protein [Flavobacteriales bacterium]|nr:DUF922 domain-containing protein [Flavobacteriales bacterium]
MPRASLAPSLLLLFAFAPEQHGRSPEHLLWPDHPTLSWSDFKGDPKTLPEGYAAITHSEISASYATDASGVRTHVQCWFVPSLSPVSRTGRTSAMLLQHEQGHFDLTEVYARQLRQAFAHERLTRGNVAKRVSFLADSVTHALDARQDLYDRETHYGQEEAVQLTWTARITKELEALEPWAVQGAR